MLNLATKDDINALDSKLDEIIAIQSKQDEIFQKGINNNEELKTALDQLDFKKAYQKIYSAYSELNQEYLRLQKAYQDMSTRLKTAEDRIKKSDTAFRKNRIKIKQLKEDKRAYFGKLLESNFDFDTLSDK